MITFGRELTVVTAFFPVGTSPRMSRDPAKAMELVDVKPGQGL